MKGTSLKNITTLRAIALIFAVLIPVTPSECKRSLGGSHRKGSSYTTHRPSSITKSTYNVGNSASSHAEQTKLSYPNYNTQLNRPSAVSQNSQSNIGWTNPNQGSHVGAPPPYSPNNMGGSAHSNIHDLNPTYQKPNYAAPPPNYNQATGSHIGSGTNNLPPGATYYSSNNIPAGANYYPSMAHVPGGGGYAASGSMPQHYQPYGALPPGATFLPAGASLPQGATYYASPVQQSSSGPGLGTGLIAGALGGAILGHVLTPTQTKVVEHSPTSTNDGNSGNDRIIIINNSGQPINATSVDNNTVINPGSPALADMSTSASVTPIPNNNMDNSTNTATPSDNTSSSNALPMNEQPAPGGIICVPIRVNETDPNDSSKMIEIEKIACYPAPLPPQAIPMQTPDANSSESKTVLSSGMPPLAPLQNEHNAQSQVPTQPTLLAEQSPVRQAPSKGTRFHDNIVIHSIIIFIMYYVMISA